MNRITLDHHDNDSNKKMKYDDNEMKMRLKELYSVSAFEDTPTISQSQSPTDARGDMNMTKQDQHCNVKPPPLCGLATDNNDKRHANNIMTDSIMNNIGNNSDRKKKSVSFLPQVSTSNSISTSTSKNKTQLWYTSSEYDQFKYQAALDCGIKLMQLNNVSSSQKNDGKRKRRGQFIQVGDFDCKKNENINDNTTINVTSHPSLSSMDTPPTDNTKDKKYSRYYNENEYNDQVSSTAMEEQTSSTPAQGKVVDLISNESPLQQEEPTVVCKRGLGYHFSRTRKRARMSTRSAVLAWQKNLRGASNTSNSQTTANDKSTMMLALVSSKCSRVAREEAKWRGLVDYKVAYPERHQEFYQASIANDKVQFDNDMNMNDKKRPYDSTAAPIIHTDTARCNKRQRTNSGNDTDKMQRRNGTVFDTNGNDRDELILSPETVGYLVNGVQYAKV